MHAEGPSVSLGGASWRTTTLGAVASIHPGSTPRRVVPEYWDGTIPWVTPGELTGLRTKYLFETREKITRAGLAGCAATVVPRDSLLVTTRATLGAAALAAMPITTNQGFRSLVFNGGADPHFFYHLTPTLLPELTRRASGTTFLEISGKEFQAISVLLPPLPEQRRIAEILDTLDEAIRSTEQVIAKLQQMKQGLLHDLLACGIDENGELRDPDRQPEQFRDSPLGRVPRGWDIVTLGSRLSAIDAGWSPLCPEEPPVQGQWGVLKVSAVSSGTYAPLESKRLPSELRPVPTLEVRSGDVLCVRANGVAELVGVSAFVESTPSRLMLSDKTLRLRPSGEMRPKFLHFLMGGAGVRRRIGQLLNGSSGQRNISQEQLRSIHVAVPLVPEQAGIEAAVAAVEVRIREECLQLDKCRALKNGLMDDLLTGRVRVTLPGEATL